MVNILLSTLGFQALNWASVMPYFLSIVSHWSPDAMRWKPLQLDGVPGWTGSYWEAVVVAALVVLVVVAALVVFAGSAVTVPITQ